MNALSLGNLLSDTCWYLLDDRAESWFSERGSLLSWMGPYSDAMLLFLKRRERNERISLTLQTSVSRSAN